MKVKIILLSLPLIAALGLGLASADTKGKPSTSEPFHIARSPAEKALDGILHRTEKDGNIIHYVRGTPYYDAKKDSGYSRLFTKKFLRAVAKEESDLVKESCDGKYTGEICGLDFVPLLCAQDYSEKGYLYQTIEDDGHKAIILCRWVGHDIKTLYRLIKDGDDWKFDGVDCGRSFNFNMD